MTTIPLKMLPALCMAFGTPDVGERMMLVTLCSGGHALVEVPGKHREDPCPGACHAITCERKRLAQADPSEDK